jgi:hypothetical protein
VGSAQAQSSDELKLAQTLFDQGSRLVEAGRYEQACPKLEAAQRLVSGIGVTLYLGECYERTGRLQRAWEQFKTAETLAAARSDTRVKVAHDRAALLWPKLARLRIVVPSAADVTGLVVTDEGTTVERASWDAERPVPPGLHHVRARAPGREPWEKSITVAWAAGTTSVEVPPLKELSSASAAPAPAPPPPTQTPPAEPPAAGPAVAAPPPAPPLTLVEHRDTPPAQRIAGAAIFGVGVVGVGVASFFGLRARSELDDSNASGHCKANDHCDATGLSQRSDAIDAATVSTIAFIGGAACLVGGAVVYLTAGRSSQAADARVAAAARSERGGATVSLLVRW